MNHKLVLLLFFTRGIIGNVDNEFLIDYFQHKSIPSVVGFSCNNAKDDLSLAKKLNKIDVMVSLKKLNTSYSINRFAFTNYYNIGIFMDSRCYATDRVVSVLTEASDYRMYGELHHWLVFGTNVKNVTDILDDSAFGFSTNFVIVVPSDDDQVKTYDIYDVYNIWKERGAKLDITYFGSWSPDKKLNVVFNDTKFRRRSNLHGLVMKASFFWSKFKPPGMPLEDYLQDYASTTRDALSKFGFSTVKYLSELFNFKLQCGFVAKWKVGDATGPIIRALYNNEIDITGTPATMNVKRTYLVKYIYQSWPFRTCFIFRSPQPKDIKVNEVFRPFEMNVWYLTFIFFSLNVWVIASVFRYENNDSLLMRYSDSVLVNVGAICQQGTDLRMIHTSTRIAFFFILIFNFLIYNYYSSSIVTARLNEPIFKLNDSLSQLSKTNMKVASEWMVYFELFIKKQDWETKTFYTKSWLQVPESERFMDPEKALRLVQRGGFAYHMHPDVGYPFINRFFDNRAVCELTEIHLANPTYSTFAVNINSTFEDMMRIGLIKISEVGLRRRQLLRWTTRKPQCFKNILSASGTDIYEFAPHLLILAFGIILSIAFCVVEKISVSQNVSSIEFLLKVWIKKRR